MPSHTGLLARREVGWHSTSVGGGGDGSSRALLHVGMTKTKLEPEQLTPGVSPSSGGMIQPGDLAKGPGSTVAGRRRDRQGSILLWSGGILFF